MATTIEEYMTLNIADLKRMGFLNPRNIVGGRIRLKTGNTIGTQIGVVTDTRAVPMCFLLYSYNGKPKQEQIRLIFKHSNLNHEGGHGYYYFVCPVSGKCCRKLYAVNGRFVGRSAFRPLYLKQAQSHKEREKTDWLEALQVLDLIIKGKHRKEYYRGKRTPYSIRLEKYIARTAKRNPNDPLFGRLNALLKQE